MNGTTLVIRDYEGDAVFFQSDASLNATEIAKRFGKRTENWLRSDRTPAYRDAVARRMGVTLKSVTKNNQPVSVRQGTQSGEQGMRVSAIGGCRFVPDLS